MKMCLFSSKSGEKEIETESEQGTSVITDDFDRDMEKSIKSVSGLTYLLTVRNIMYERLQLINRN